MHVLGYLIVGVLVLAGLSAASDGQWGRGVRGAARGLSPGTPRGVRDRLSAARDGWVSGRQDTSPSTRRTVGKTPPDKTALTGVWDRLSGTARGVLGRVRGRVSGHGLSPDGHPWPRLPMLLVRPDATAKEIHVDRDDQDGWPELNPGERLHHLDRFGTALPDPWTYEDQQARRRMPPVPRVLVCLDPRCPNRFDVGEGFRGDFAWEVIKANWLLDGPGAWCPEHRPDRDTYHPYEETDEGRAWVAQAAEARDNILARRGGAPDNEGDTMSVTQLTSPAPGGAGAIENLNDYRRYLTGVLTAAQTEYENAEAGRERLKQFAQTITDGVDRLAALRADAATSAEGNQVAEAAKEATKAAGQLAAALAFLADATKVAADGARRHDQVQESHNAGVHLDRAAYNGS